MLFNDRHVVIDSNSAVVLLYVTCWFDRDPGVLTSHVLPHTLVLVFWSAGAILQRAACAKVPMYRPPGSGSGSATQPSTSYSCCRRNGSSGMQGQLLMPDSRLRYRLFAERAFHWCTARRVGRFQRVSVPLGFDLPRSDMVIITLTTLKSAPFFVVLQGSSGLIRSSAF